MTAVDDLLGELVRRCDAAFPGQSPGYYLVGSYAVGEPTPSSDVDVVVVFRAPLDEDGQARFARVRGECRAASPLVLDCSATSEETLLRVGGVWFQTASRLIAGEDIRPRVPQKPAASHARDLMHGVLPLIMRARGNPAALELPLAFPDPGGPLYGYDGRRVSAGGELRPVGTKDLASIVLAIANALTWRAAGRYVGRGRKRDIPEQYALVIGDRWAPLVAAAFERCRIAWDYKAPEGPAELEELREICRGALGFENHFIETYAAFLEAERGDPDPRVAGRAEERAALLRRPEL